MSSEFPRILTLLRKEKGISQKSAAVQLGVSQALLSHYENGIRECGLDFLCRAAAFYGVSSDYLLGLTPDRTGITLTIDEIPESDAGGKENQYRNGVLCTLNKKLIGNSLNILYDLLNRAGSSSLVGEISDFLMLSVYRMLRVLHRGNHRNQDAMFKLPSLTATPYCEAEMCVCEANATAIAKDRPPEGMDRIEDSEALRVTTESISTDYPLFGTSLLNLISTVEKRVRGPRDPSRTRRNP